jgi:hypothetical protein
MKNNPHINYGQVYHIYNRGNNGEDLFLLPEDNKHFLRLYEKYIEPIADTFAWCLLRNHFHLLVKIKHKEEIGYFHPLYSSGINKTNRESDDFNEDCKWIFISEKEIENFKEVKKEAFKRPTP